MKLKVFHRQSNIINYYSIVMGSSWKQIVLTAILLTTLRCNQWHLSTQNPAVTISQDKQDTPKVISISGQPLRIQMLKSQQPIYLNRRISDNVPEPNKIQYSSDILQNNPAATQLYELRNIDYLHSRLNSLPSSQLDASQLKILKGMQKLVQQSNDRVIGRINYLENRLDRAIFERDSIIRAINIPPLNPLSVPAPSLYLTTQSIPRNIASNEVIYSTGSRNIGNNILIPDSYPQRLSCSIISGQNGPQCNREQEQIQPQSSTHSRLDRAVDETQRRIDSLEAVMLARQRKMIMNRLARDYKLGEMEQLQGDLPFQNYPSLRADLDLRKVAVNGGQSLKG